jgi:hypothetical protein
MKPNMDKDLHHQAVQRALTLGRGTDPAVLPEFIALLKHPSSEVRRLSASAIGKLAVFGANPAEAVAALGPVALKDPHPQVQQYAIKGLKVFGASAQGFVRDLDDLAANPHAKDYVRRTAHSAAEGIHQALQERQANARRKCQRCGRELSADEAARSRLAFQRPFCDPCFDEVYLERRNFETKVELNKTIRAKAGTLVQSRGEQMISDWLAAHGMAFRYDERYRILEGYAIRPDFYLPELDVYIEYWGLDTAEYKIGMLKKQQLYQHEGKRLISIYPKDKGRLDEVLRSKLRMLGFAASASVSEPAG